ncbi:hypothetical protein [Megamonas funiformis]|uniref:hypothetical protein n=1 Tax=Megamonas funiformis TaxID=437897 RepID=UPI0024ACD74A|nr:hypothetical protein [Megamonas funiformis]
MNKKMNMFKEVLREYGNEHLFEKTEQNLLVGRVTLKDKGKTSVLIIMNLDDEIFDNTIEIVIKDIDLQKKYKALELVNELSQKYKNGNYYLWESQNGTLSFWRRDVYTASLDDFKPEYFNLILLRALNDIEKDDIVEIMRLVWA